MATYTRLGSYLLDAELTADPAGSIHRGIVIAGSAFERFVLVRSFGEEFYQAGLATRLPEASRALPLLGGSRAFGVGYRIEGGKTPHVAWDYVQGRSLAQLVEKAKQEQVPFGVDHALSVLQGVAQALVQMHSKGLTHGFLSPHSVWVSFEGATQIVDAPFAAVLRSLLPKAPLAQSRLETYLQAPEGNPFQQDLFSLGAILYELLTFDRLPYQGDLRAALERATLKAAQEDGPLPAEIKQFLARLLLLQQPFTSVDAFNAELERVLYDGDYSPTTFNMAFFMHTLFREENDKDAAGMKAAEADNYTAYTAAGDALRSGAARAQHIDLPEGEDEASKNRKLLVWGGGVAVALILGLGYVALSKPKVDPAIQAQLAELQRRQAEMEQIRADLEAKTKAESDRQAQIQKQLAENKLSAQEKAALEKQLEESQKKAKELEQKKQRVVEEKKQAEVKVAQVAQAAQVPPPAPVQIPAPAPQPVTPPAPKEEPKPQPVAPKEEPKPAPAPVQQAPAPSAAAVEVPARVASQVAPAYPARARTARFEANRDHMVRLKVFVDEQGRALKVNIVEGVPGPYGFDESAQEAALKSSFNPATRDGRPVRGWAEVVYKFPRISH